MRWENENQAKCTILSVKFFRWCCLCECLIRAILSCYLGGDVFLYLCAASCAHHSKVFKAPFQRVLKVRVQIRKEHTHTRVAMLQKKQSVQNFVILIFRLKSHFVSPAVYQRQSLETHTKTSKEECSRRKKKYSYIKSHSPIARWCCLFNVFCFVPHYSITIQKPEPRNAYMWIEPKKMLEISRIKHHQARSLQHEREGNGQIHKWNERWKISNVVNEDN